MKCKLDQPSGKPIKFIAQGTRSGKTAKVIIDAMKESYNNAIDDVLKMPGIPISTQVKIQRLKK